MGNDKDIEIEKKRKVGCYLRKKKVKEPYINSMEKLVGFVCGPGSLWSHNKASAYPYRMITNLSDGLMSHSDSNVQY